jgi:hypothetical protein
MSSSGLGGLSVNTIVLPFYEIAGLTTGHAHQDSFPLGSAASYESLEERLRNCADDESEAADGDILMYANLKGERGGGGRHWPATLNTYESNMGEVHA